MKIRILITTLLCALMLVEAQGRDVYSTPADTTQNALDKLIGLAEKVLDLVTYNPDSSRYSFAIYPAASYGHRTGLELGLMPIMQVKSLTDRQSSIVMGLLVSTKKMWEVQLDMDLYPSDNISVVGKIEWMRLPDEFYLLGNKKKGVAAEMLTRTLSANPAMLIRIGESNWEVGPTLRYYYASYKDIEARDVLRRYEIEAILEGSSCSSFGLGLRLRRDTRDNNDWPRSGSLFDYEIDGWKNSNYGGVGNFMTMTADYRKYVSIKKTVLAAQACLSNATGKTPIHLLPTFGGTRLDRAVGHNLKYLGDIAWFTQVEWRTPLFWRLGATVFTGVGRASDELKDAFKDTHGVIGAGLRFKVFPKSGMNIRLDYGRGTHGDHGFYLNVKEGF